MEACFVAMESMTARIKAAILSSCSRMADDPKKKKADGKRKSL
jgi:hypothetical protein